MSGQHRKVSRSTLDSSSGFVTSRSHLTQPENELRLKLDAIDSSMKISSKKISKETRELRQILFDLQRDLKVSKSLSHYVPSPIEEQESKQRRVRVTVSTTPGDLRLDCDVIHKGFTKDGEKAEKVPEEDPGISTKRRRKTSVPIAHKDKILVKDDDVFVEDEGSDNVLSKEKVLGVEEKGIESSENKRAYCAVGGAKSKQQQEAQTNMHTDTSCGSCEVGAQDRAQPFHCAFSSNTIQGRLISSNSSMDCHQGIEDIDGDKTQSTLLSHKVVSSFHNPESQSLRKEISRKDLTGLSGSVATYSKCLSEGRRSFSESETINRETFKGRFVTNSLSRRDQVQGVLPFPESQKRRRRITVAGIHPAGARCRLDVGGIPVTPFHPESRKNSANCTNEDRRKTIISQTRERKPGLPVAKENEQERNNNLLSPTRDVPRYRRTSVRKIPSLPPLTEERTLAQQTANLTAIPNEWKNLENCRYLRKGDCEISIDDVFTKD